MWRDYCTVNATHVTCIDPGGPNGQRRLVPINMDPGLRSVEIIGFSLGDFSDRFAVNLRQLERLVLRDTSIRFMDDFTLSLLPSLTSLDLSGNHLPARLVFFALPASNQLTYLNLDAYAGEAPLQVARYGMAATMDPLCGSPSPPQLVLGGSAGGGSAMVAVTDSSGQRCWRPREDISGQSPRVVRCPGADACDEMLPETSLCDNIRDCSDGSDESAAFCSWDLDLVPPPEDDDAAPECKLLLDCYTSGFAGTRHSGLVRLELDTTATPLDCQRVLYLSPDFGNMFMAPMGDNLYFYHDAQEGIPFNISMAWTAEDGRGVAREQLLSLTFDTGIRCDFTFKGNFLRGDPCSSATGGSSSAPVAAIAAGAGAVCAVLVCALIYFIVVRKRRRASRGRKLDSVAPQLPPHLIYQVRD